MNRKGILLAGGAGTRLHPLTIVTSKQLLPVYDKPMVYYPLTTLMLAGIRDALVITDPTSGGQFKRLLGDGSQWGMRIDYAVQPSPDGIAQALVIGEDFLDGAPCCLVLGDNILFGHGLPDMMARATARTDGATVIGYRVRDPERYGVVSFAADGRATEIVEKPKEPASDWAVIGLYFYDGTASARAKSLKLSPRGEYEITDLNNAYLADGKLSVEPMGRGFAWLDAGTHASLLEAGEFVRVVQRRQQQLIASPEEIAFLAGWIDGDAFQAQIDRYAETEYGRLLELVLRRGG